MKSNIYSVDYYIKYYGISEKEAILKVKQNKENTARGIRLQKAKKRIEKYKIENVSPEQLIQIENSILSIKNSCKFTYKLYPIIQKIIKNNLNMSVIDAMEHYKKVLLKYPKNKKVTSNTESIKDLYGKDSEEYKEKLELNKSINSCSFEEFAKKYDNIELAKKDFCKKYGSNNLEGLIERYGISEEEARCIVKERISKAKETFNSKSDEFKQSVKNSKSNTLENFIRRYGEKEGGLKYEKYISNINGRTSLEYYKNKYGDDIGMKIFQEKKGKHKSVYCEEYWLSLGYSEKEAKEKLKTLFNIRSNFSLQFCIKKYGEKEGFNVWKERQYKWQNTLNSRSEEEKIYINKRKGITLENQILKYGEKLGNIKYNEFLIKQSRTMHSKSSRNFFIKLYKKLRKANIIERKDVYFGIDGSKEYFIFDGEKVRFYDFCIPKLKYMCEYNGVAFHPRSNQLDWKSAFGMSYEEAFNNDEFKRNLANENGFILDYVWEDGDPEVAIETIYNNILNIHNRA